MEDKLIKECTEKCDIDPNSGNLGELECVQTEYDQLCDYITQGAIIHSRQPGMKWVRKTTKNLNFLNSSTNFQTSSCGFFVCFCLFSFDEIAFLVF